MEEKITNTSELLARLDSDEFKTRFDFVKEEVLLFRGQGSINFDLVPSIGRYPNTNIGNPLVWFEKNIYDAAKNAFPSEFSDDLKPIDLLAKLQHFGIPTRLLDVTSNPLVALYFACCEPLLLGCDGELFVLKNSSSSPTYAAIVEAIADTANNSFKELDSFLKESTTKKYFDNERFDLEVILENNPNYGNVWIKECCKKPMFINRADLTTRQKLQSGKFLLFSNDIVTYSSDNETKKYMFGDYISPINKVDTSIVVCRFIIPKECKKSILEQLNKIGINRRTLFADSIDIVCDEIKKHYYERYRDDFI